MKLAGYLVLFIIVRAWHYKGVHNIRVPLYQYLILVSRTKNIAFPSCMQGGGGGGGGTWPMFGYRGAAKGLKSWPCLGQKYAKNPTLCRTTASISRPILFSDKMHTHWFYRNLHCLISHSNHRNHARCIYNQVVESLHWTKQTTVEH